MKMSARGRDLLTQREGVRLAAYRDSVGVWTIGIGHTSMAGPPKVTPNLRLTRAEVDEIFARDLLKYESAVRTALNVLVEQHEFDALVSFCYNIGPAGLMRSSVIKKLNAGNRKAAADAFLMWNKPPEIMGRRRGERTQFLTPYPGEKKPSPAPKPEPAPLPPDVEPAPVPAPEKPAEKRRPWYRRALEWFTGAGGFSVFAYLTDWKVVATIGAVALVGFLCWWFLIRKKKR